MFMKLKILKDFKSKGHWTVVRRRSDNTSIQVLHEYFRNYRHCSPIFDSSFTIWHHIIIQEAPLAITVYFGPKSVCWGQKLMIDSSRPHYRP